MKTDAAPASPSASQTPIHPSPAAPRVLRLGSTRDSVLDGSLRIGAPVGVQLAESLVEKLRGTLDASRQGAFNNQLAKPMLAHLKALERTQNDIAAGRVDFQRIDDVVSKTGFTLEQARGFQRQMNGYAQFATDAKSFIDAYAELGRAITGVNRSLQEALVAWRTQNSPATDNRSASEAIAAVGTPAKSKSPEPELPPAQVQELDRNPLSGAFRHRDTYSASGGKISPHMLERQEDLLGVRSKHSVRNVDWHTFWGEKGTLTSGFYGPNHIHENYPRHESKGTVFLEFDEPKRAYPFTPVERLRDGIYKLRERIMGHQPTEFVNCHLVVSPPRDLHRVGEQHLAIDDRAFVVTIGMKMSREEARKVNRAIRQEGAEAVLQDLFAHQVSPGGNRIERALHWIKDGMMDPLAKPHDPHAWVRDYQFKYRNAMTA